MVAGKLRIHNAVTGALITEVVGEPFVARALVAETSGGSVLIVTSAQLKASWRAFDESGSLVWKQSSIADQNPARWWGTLPALARGAVTTYIGTIG